MIVPEGRTDYSIREEEYTMNPTVVRVTLAKQLLERAIVALAIVGILALLGGHIDLVGTAAIYAAVGVAHTLWMMVIVGGIKLPVALPKKEKAPVGFKCPTEAVASSADRIRRETQDRS
jgi:hypothetical protein